MNKFIIPLSSSKKLQLISSIWIGLSILYQVYFFEFKNGTIIGGESQRLFLKFVFTVLFTLSVSNYLSWSAFFRNFFHKLPILYVVISISLLAPLLASDYLQALNIVFFLPIMFIDWNRDGGEKLYTLIWIIITVTTLVQLVMDPLFKLYFDVYWTNKAMIGGMGNPNVFGIFLIASGLVSEFLITSWLKYFSIFLFFSTALTGSLVSLIIGFVLILIKTKYYLKNSPIKSLLLFGLILITLNIIVLDDYFSNDFRALNHALGKLDGVINVLNNDSTEASSLSIRMEYFRDGLMLIEESPLSLIFGHPDFLPMYNGDGLWTSFLVSYGLPLTLYFLMVNLMLIYRGIRLRTHVFKFSSSVIFVCMCFFVTNRILDYWPAAFIYILAFTYLSNKIVTVGNCIR